MDGSRIGEMAADFFRALVQMYRPAFAFLLFVAQFTAFHLLKPAFAYLPSGGFRPFGVGRRRKTVLSAWVVAMVLAIFSYLAILRYTG